MTDNFNKKVWITPNIKGFTLIYNGNKGATEYILYYNNTELTSIGATETPEQLSKLLYGVTTAKLDNNLNDFPNEIKTIYTAIVETLTDAKPYEKSNTIRDLINHIDLCSDETTLIANINGATDEIKEKLTELAPANDFNTLDLNTDIEFTNRYIQKSNGLYGVNKKDDLYLIAKMVIKEIQIVSDRLGLFEPVYNMKYRNLVFNQDRTIYNLTFEELTSYINSDMCFLATEQTTQKTLRDIIIIGANTNYDGRTIITAKTDLFKQGFFYDSETNKVLSNNVFDDLEPTKENISDAINLVNNLIANRGTAKPNDCTVFRFMLYSPFSWILKEIGVSRSNYGLVLIGKSQTNKTGSCENFSYLYSNPSDIILTADTVSAFGSQLEKNTLPTVIDEAFNLINIADMEEINKRVIYNKNSRATKNRTDNKKIDDFKALSLPVFTLNQEKKFKSEFKRRYKIIEYDSSMIISDNARTEFEKEFKPNSPETPLKQLKYLGKAFATEFIKYIENQDAEHQRDSIYDLEPLIIEILKKIAETVGTPFDNAVYKIQQSSNKFDIEKDILLKTGLSELFRKAHRRSYNAYDGYSESDFIACANNNEISWIHYISSKDLYAIAKSEFETEVSNILGENTTIEEAFNMLDIELDKSINIDGFKTVAKHKGKSKQAVKITPFDLIYKLFNIQIHEHKELIEQEETKAELEEEADAILNKHMGAKPI